MIFGVAPLLSAAGLPAGNPDDLGFSRERLERLDAVLQDYVTAEDLAGTVVLVARDGKVAHLATAGYRDRELEDPMRADTIFRIASQSKAVISVGVMMLQEEGRLLISDPVGDYLPEFNETTVAEPQEDGGYEIVPAKRKITIRDLLTHTSGVSYGWGTARDKWEEAGVTGWYFAHRDEPIRETVRRMAALPFEAHPGTRWVYGYNIDILGAVIEAASGQPLDQFLQERIFGPLGMVDTCFFLPPEKRDRLATVYGRPAGGDLVRSPDEGTMQAQGAYVDGPRKCFSGGAGLLSTAADYTRFLQMILNGGELDGARLLSPKTVQLMASDQTTGMEASFGTDDGGGFGLGFSVLKDLGARGELGTVGELGWGGAYHSTYWIDPVEKLVVTYFTQVTPAGGLDDHDKLRALVYAAMIDSNVK